MLKAIDKFDCSYEVKLSTYAVPMIAGEIKRFLRDDGMIKVSRTLKENGYIRFEPKIKMTQHEEVKSYLLFSFDNFTRNISNPQFRDCSVFIDVLCHTDCWDLGGFRNRPLKICGYIDAILNNT